MDAREKLVEAVRKAAVERDGRLTIRCADAFRVAGQAKTDLMEVGRVCNEEDVRIVTCQLGCFK